MRKTAIIDIDNTLWQFCDAFYLELKKINANFPTPISGRSSTSTKAIVLTRILPPSARSMLNRTATNTSHTLKRDHSSRPCGYRVLTSSSQATGRKPRGSRRKDGSPATGCPTMSFIFPLTRQSFSGVPTLSWTMRPDARKGDQERGPGRRTAVPLEQGLRGNGFGLFQDLNGVLGYIMKRLG